MGRTALAAEHVADIAIDQKKDIGPDQTDRDGEIVRAEQLIAKDYLDELAFNEEPVTIRLEPTAERNAPTSFPVWVNGKGCEVWQNGQWQEIAYLPVGRIVTVKRKYLEVIIRAKLDTVNTEVKEKDSEHPNNVIQRFTSAVHSFSIIEDENPKGIAWLTELRRRNM